MSDIGVLTTTFYKSMEELRFHLACQLVGNAIAVGHGVMVVDGSPDAAIGRSFLWLGAAVLPQTASGLGRSRRELFRHALDQGSHRGLLPQIFLWTEEKVDLVRWIPRIAAPIERGEADIVIPARTDQSWASYPAFQIESEKAANAVYAEVTGNAFDAMFGPVAYSRRMGSYFAECNPKERYGAADNYIQHVAPLEAMADGARVVSVPVDFFYPSAQKAEEEAALSEAMREKRRRQFEDCTQTYRLVAAALGLPKRKNS
ncbi:MAG: hypothetical protein HYT40_04150 [Candidatus Sungbacteria bacterium]|uniref:Uncharacterized protein n=1 Tax=Candidatus Sungiibacteriota bacterium TaxID=2750080 RepID=A0A931SEP7_9BACT|nr:hypothetical protein [Candidatus Sungbacteria bacterium]